MKIPFLQKTWPWAILASVLLILFLTTVLDVTLPGVTGNGASAQWLENRPTGTLEDVERFAEREDSNVLFIMIDTLRADRLSAYGYERETSPFMDRYAARGIRFDRNLAQSSWTKCSMASLWTGLYPQRTGVTRFNHGLPDEALMPAEILKDSGFRTVGIYRNGWVSGYFGFEQGFDMYIRPTARPIPASVRRANPTVSVSSSDMDVVETTSEFLRLHGDDRWFLYLHLMDVHEYVYDEQSAVFGATNKDIYDNSILREDYIIQTLLEHLGATGRLDNTLVILSSDHGEAFGERGFEGHAREIFPETTEVPLILGFPFALEEEVVVESRTANVDLWPTVLDLIGLGGSMAETDGVSRLPEIRAAANGERFMPDPDSSEETFAFLDQSWGGSGPPDPSLAVATNSFRYVMGRNVGGVKKEQLFFSPEDPDELTDVKEAHEEEFRRLQSIAAEHLEQQAPWEEGIPTLEIDEMELNQLRALGYQIP